MNLKTIFVLTIFIAVIKASCPRDDTLCARCGGDKCLFCMGSYSLSGRCTDVELVNRVDQCISFRNNAGQCAVCNYGYKLTAEFKCEKIGLKDCLEVDPNSTEEKCIMCDKRLLPDENGTCEGSEECSITNCSLCRNLTGDEECIHCANNFSILQKSDGTNECVFQNANTLNCRLTEFDNDRDCLECNVSYYYSYGKCIKSEGLEITRNFTGRDSALITSIISVIALACSLF